MNFSIFLAKANEKPLKKQLKLAQTKTEVSTSNLENRKEKDKPSVNRQLKPIPPNSHPISKNKSQGENNNLNDDIKTKTNKLIKKNTKTDKNKRKLKNNNNNKISKKNSNRRKLKHEKQNTKTKKKNSNRNLKDKINDNSKLENLSIQLNTTKSDKSSAVNRKLKATDNRTSNLNDKSSAVNRKLKATDKNTSKLNDKPSAVNRKLKATDKIQSNLNKKSEIDKNLNKVKENKLNRKNSKSNKVKLKKDNQKSVSQKMRRLIRKAQPRRLTDITKVSEKSIKQQLKKPRKLLDNIKRSKNAKLKLKKSMVNEYSTNSIKKQSKFLGYERHRKSPLKNQKDKEMLNDNYYSGLQRMITERKKHLSKANIKEIPLDRKLKQPKDKIQKKLKNKKLKQSKKSKSKKQNRNLKKNSKNKTKELTKTVSPIENNTIQTPLIQNQQTDQNRALNNQPPSVNLNPPVQPIQNQNVYSNQSYVSNNVNDDDERRAQFFVNDLHSSMQQTKTAVDSIQDKLIIMKENENEIKSMLIRLLNQRNIII